MVTFTVIILKLGQLGEKTGWTYIEIPADLANQIKPDCKKSFRIRGTLDSFKIAGIAAMPMGGGSFILPLNAGIRRGIRKGEGAMLQVSLEEDVDFKLEVPEDVNDCLADEPEALEYFNSLPESHRRYFVNWINSAKTEPTRAKRIAQTCHAMANHLDYGQMIRLGRSKEVL
jgi:hypothetical protein